MKHPTEDKAQEVVEASEPENKAPLQSFQGLLVFYNRYLKVKASIAKELYELHEKNGEWRWEERHRKAFQTLKELVAKYTVHAH